MGPECCPECPYKGEAEGMPQGGNRTCDDRGKRVEWGRKGPGAKACGRLQELGKAHALSLS